MFTFISYTFDLILIVITHGKCERMVIFLRYKPGCDSASLRPCSQPGVSAVAPGRLLLFAQSGRIEQIPLTGTGLDQDQARPLIHVPVSKSKPELMQE